MKAPRNLFAALTHLFPESHKNIVQPDWAQDNYHKNARPILRNDFLGEGGWTLLRIQSFMMRRDHGNSMFAITVDTPAPIQTMTKLPAMSTAHSKISFIDPSFTSLHSTVN